MKLFRSWILQTKEDIRSSSILRMFAITSNIYLMFHSLQSILTCILSQGPKPFLSKEDYYDSKFTLWVLCAREMNLHPSQSPSSHRGKADAFFHNIRVLTVRAHPKGSGCMGTEAKGQRSSKNEG